MQTTVLCLIIGIGGVAYGTVMGTEAWRSERRVERISLELEEERRLRRAAEDRAGGTRPSQD